VSLIDRYLQGKEEVREVADLHSIGVTCMFVASKYEDIYPLKMKMVHEKIAHKKLAVEKIKAIEMDILKVIKYKIQAPTSLDFLKVYLKQVLNINSISTLKSNAKAAQVTKDKKENADSATAPSTTTLESEMLLIDKMSMYLAKMSLHDYELQGKKASLQAIGSLYVALKICEQLKKTQLITNDIV